MDKVCEREGCKNNVAVGPGRTGKYCSKSCAASVNNKKSPKRVRTKYTGICPGCNETFASAHVVQKYCSNTCFMLYRRNAGLQEWIAGGSGSDKDGCLRLACRKYLLVQADNKCVECGWSTINQFSGKVTLTIDHIDGDSRNNNIDNLKVLCYNCHTLTPTFNQLNRGKGTRKYAPGTRRSRSKV